LIVILLHTLETQYPKIFDYFTKKCGDIDKFAKKYNFDVEVECKKYEDNLFKKLIVYGYGNPEKLVFSSFQI
jgi:hypothetical protein